MTNNEVLFMRTACEIMDSINDRNRQISDTDAIVSQLLAKGLSLTQIVSVQESLERQWLLTNRKMGIGKPLSRFDLTPSGLKWWWITKHGPTEYAALAHRAMDAFHRDDHGDQFSVMAEMAGLELRDFKDILWMETKGASKLRTVGPAGHQRTYGIGWR